MALAISYGMPQWVYPRCLPTVRFANWGGKSVVTRRCRRIWLSWFRVVCFSDLVMGSGGMILSWTNGTSIQKRTPLKPQVCFFSMTQAYREEGLIDLLVYMLVSVDMTLWWEHQWQRGWQSLANEHVRGHLWPVMPAYQLYPQTGWSADPKSWKSSFLRDTKESGKNKFITLSWI